MSGKEKESFESPVSTELSAVTAHSQAPDVAGQHITPKDVVSEKEHRVDSMPVSYVSKGVQPVITVRRGNAEELETMVNSWDESSWKKIKHEGIIMDPELTPNGGYKKDEHWKEKMFLDSGAFGRCFLAEDVGTGKEFCLKEVKKSEFEPNEVIIWSKLNHRHIVELLGVVRIPGIVHILSEYIEGCDLEKFIQDKMLDISVHITARYMSQLCEVLVYFKEKEIRHRDLKAKNIMIRSIGGDALVIDFGRARRLEKKSIRATNESDLGSVLWVAIHMIKRREPVIEDSFPSLGDIPKETDPELKRLLERCIEVNENNPSNIEELRKEFLALANQFDFNEDVDTKRDVNTVVGDMKSLEVADRYTDDHAEMEQDYVTVEQATCNVHVDPRMAEDTVVNRNLLADSYYSDGKLNGACYSEQATDE